MVSKKVKVNQYKRSLPNKGKLGKRVNVRPYKRAKRPEGKRKIISKKPVKLYQIRDEFGQVKGFSSKPPKKKNFGSLMLPGFSSFESENDDYIEIPKTKKKKNYGSFTALGRVSPIADKVESNRTEERKRLARLVNNIGRQIDKTVDGRLRDHMESERSRLVAKLTSKKPIEFDKRTIQLESKFERPKRLFTFGKREADIIKRKVITNG